MYMSDPCIVKAETGVSATCEVDSHTIIRPFEPNYKYIIAIKNTGDKPDLFSIAVKGEESRGWLVLGASGFIWLNPDEVGYHIVIVEPMRDVKDGDQLILSFVISSTTDPSKKASITLTTTLKDLGSLGDLPCNSMIQGKIYDEETEKPIANAEVKLYLWNPNEWYQTSTQSDGSYKIRCISYEYMKKIHDKYNIRGPPLLYLEVHAEGYRSYYEVDVKPPEGGVLTRSIYLKKQPKVCYRVSWEDELGFGVWKAPASKSWEYIAASTGSHNPPEGETEVTYGIYLYNSSGGLIWHQKTAAQVWGIDISQDGRFVAAGSSDPDDKIYIYDRIKDYLWIHNSGGEVREVKFSHDGRYLAAGPVANGGAGSIGLFEVSTHQLLWMRDTGDWVREIAFSPDGSYVAVANSASYLYVFSIEDGRLVWRRFHGGYVPFVLEISQDGSRILTGGKSHEIRMLDRDGNLLWSYPTDQVITDGRMDANGSLVIVGTVWGGIYCLNGEGKLLWRMVRDVGHNAVYMTKNGRYIALGGKGIILLNNEGTTLWRSEEGWVNYVAVSEDGSKIIAGYEEPRVIRLYERVKVREEPAETETSLMPYALIVVLLIALIIAILYRLKMKS